MTTYRSQIGKFPHAAPNLGDISPGTTTPLPKPNTKPHSSLNNENLPGLYEKLPEFRLDVQTAFLGAEEEVPVVVAECSPRHPPVDHVDVERGALADIRVPGAGERVQAVDEVCGFGGWGDGEGRPFCLLGERGDGGVAGEEAVLDIGAGLDLFVSVWDMLLANWRGKAKLEFCFEFWGVEARSGRGEKGGLTMGSSRPHPIHISTKIRMSRRRKRRIRNSLSV